MPAPGTGEATRLALLRATVDCLTEHGWAGLTTRRIAATSGVTRGALQHHFGSKGELVAAAILWLVEEALADLQGELAALPDDADRLGAVLDVTWRAHQGPLFDATVELLVAARSDHEIAQTLASIQLGLTARLAGAYESFVPAARRASFATDFAAVLATMRGFALLRFAGVPSRTVDGAWRRERDAAVACLG